jgi:hypothetical protein
MRRSRSSTSTAIVPPAESRAASRRWRRGRSRQHERLAFGCLARLVKSAAQSREADEKDANGCSSRTVPRLLAGCKLCLAIFP